MELSLQKITTENSKINQLYSLYVCIIFINNANCWSHSLISFPITGVYYSSYRLFKVLNAFQLNIYFLMVMDKQLHFAQTQKH